MSDWSQRAACRDVDPDSMFPNRNHPQRIEESRAVCLRCPVRAECLRFALETGNDYGTAGGLSEAEREVLHERANTGTVDLATLAGAVVAEFDQLEARLAEEAEQEAAERAAAAAAGRGALKRIDPTPALFYLPGVVYTGDRMDLSDAGWCAVYAVIHRHLIARREANGGRGREWPRPEERRYVAGCVLRLATGTPWRRLPGCYGKPDTLKHRYAEWVEAGVWSDILAALGHRPALVPAA